jgi:hypothetical protein
LPRKDKAKKTKCQELKDTGRFGGLNTIGDRILDFIIIDHFAAVNENLTPEQINKYREVYGKNETLQ